MVKESSPRFSRTRMAAGARKTIRSPSDCFVPSLEQYLCLEVNKKMDVSEYQLLEGCKDSCKDPRTRQSAL